MIEFDKKIYFLLLGIIPVLIVVFAVIMFWKYKAQKKFAKKELLSGLAPTKSVFKPILKVVVLVLVVFLLVVALVNPKMGTKMETVKREGVDVVFALDVSKSMLAEDIAPNRIEKAKRIVSEIMDNLVSDRIGIIAYAAQAYPQLPITTDYNAGKMFLQSMNTDMLSSQGTAINQAIELAKTYYNDDNRAGRVLIILSDGEDHSEEDLALIDDAVDKGIKIFTIGLGDAKGTVIPIKDKNGIVQSYKKDGNGETVITKLNEDNLKKIAEEGKGKYLSGNDTDKVVKYITEALNNMDKTTFESKQYTDFEDQFQWFLGAALLLLVLDVFLLERKTKWVQKLNLFNERN